MQDSKVANYDLRAGMYMCDKPLPQQKLANQLAKPLLDILENPKLKSKTARIQAALSYLSVFWTTIVREWSGIDKHRCVSLSD
jgi:ribosomal RNA-processing protein 1